MAGARITDVTIKATGLGDNIIPTGVTISYGPGAIPVAQLSFVPGKEGDPYVTDTASLLESIDSKKRKEDITIDVSVAKWVSSLNGQGGGKVTKTLKFQGFLDGVTIMNAVGRNSYQAIIKNKAQVALELTTYTPGLTALSVNVFKNPMIGMRTDANRRDDQASVAFSNIIDTVKPNVHPIVYYRDLLLTAIDIQLGKWPTYVGYEKNALGNISFKQIFEHPVYKKNLNLVKKLFQEVDLSAVTGGALSRASAVEIHGSLRDLFASGPNTILDNFLNFLQAMNCTLIISNSKMYVVPNNSVLKQPHIKPNKGQLQNEPNAAGPADYMSYSYNDNGYKDFAHVVVLQAGIFGGAYNAGRNTLDRTVSATYTDEDYLANSCGVLAVRAHPWMVTSPVHAQPKDVIDGKKAVTKGDPKHNSTNFNNAAELVQQKTEQRNKEKMLMTTEEFKEALQTFAKTKFYQARFTDRTGSLDMDFNPGWVPGTGGTFYIRETDMWVDFYVTNVTHRIETNATNQGNASTSVSFCCARMGKEPKGVDVDAYLGYSLDKEDNIQDAFLGDIM